ncbi:MAG: hypothetical protein COT39_02220 [Parcubacteria group bacterium CG08_land_8_20_14_0_20_48_21]|nr:MAG: hypothetical protein AUK21_01575 [Parcubacteria group bacterium CG2_30_48_51]PIS32882.1 MAG: hypothetical protein COT39_02220 [Parcubacteria group bacterium CG08_land_8_20_14_0_20_48_21]PIW78780.1 MAG: hypothetical protein COZ99_04530 [Parcubacteria group bacterium CG_4_8_14_3_um_filter_48_16]PIY78251.1 MAG: hypothetical protein COY83_00860 [Parcubacteria group bacterium CG_4_10_14_0_8_um_filter_48_154]PIZ77602.1 MAG: hypothetical protein COY03_02245 [bacterium CG_4_10_14_0_2_um_filter_
MCLIKVDARTLLEGDDAMRYSASMRNIMNKNFQIFRKPMYTVLALSVACAILVLSLWLPNRSVLWYTLTAPIFDIGTKLYLITLTLGTYWSTYLSPILQIMTVLTAILAGINIALVVYYIRVRTRLTRSASIGIVGVVSGLLGIGCASCGSVLLSSILGLSATVRMLGFLPFNGLEFGVIGPLLLGASIFIVAYRIASPSVCEVVSEKS